jgi:hypothetical protein
MSATCTKTYQIVIDPVTPTGDYCWWKFAELSGNRVDSIQGVNMAVTANGSSTEGRTSGIIDFAAILNCNTPDGQVIATTGSQVPLAPSASGMTVCGWVSWDGSGYPPGVDFYLQFDIVYTSTESLFMSGSVYSGSISNFVSFGTFSEALQSFTFNGSDWPTAGQLVFFAMVHDIGALQAYCYIGVPGQPLVLVSTRAASGVAGGFGALGYIIQATGGASLPSIETKMSEWGFFPQPLSFSQLDYLYNSGIGRTSPITLP